ncbi:efflux RND transporter periplasmic adaptor subunit [Flavitalea flava]
MRITWITMIAFFLACNGKKQPSGGATDTMKDMKMDKNSAEQGTDSMKGMDMTTGTDTMKGMRNPEKSTINKKGNLDTTGIKLSEQQIQLGNIQTDTINFGMMGDRIVLTATINMDERKTTSVSARVMGRVEKLYFKNTGDYVKKGEKLYDLYSEDLNNAKQELIATLQQKQVLDSALIDFDRLIESAKYKLKLWGMSEVQIGELVKTQTTSPLTAFYSGTSGYITTLDIKEGGYTMEGGTLMRLADLSTVWAEAQVYASQLAQVDRNGMAEVQIPDLGGKRVTGKIEFVNPEINPDTRINLVRVSIPNPGNQLKPGMPAYVFLRNPRHDMFSLPIDAVLRDGKGATVWLQSGKNRFISRMVEVGMETGDRIAIKSGLTAGDIVVIRGAYLINSEYIFKQGASPMGGMKM